MGETEPKPPAVASPETRLVLCECGRPDCMEYIELDLEAIRVFLRNGWPMIVLEHQVSREAAARARVAELRAQLHARGRATAPTEGRC